MENLIPGDLRTIRSEWILGPASPCIPGKTLNIGSLWPQKNGLMKKYCVALLGGIVEFLGVQSYCMWHVTHNQEKYNPIKFK